MKGSIRALCVVLVLGFGATQTPASEPRPFGAQSWGELTRAKRDRPMIVHFWSLTCGICLGELVDWAEFATKHPGVRLVLVNWDDRVEDAKRIKATLAKNGLSKVENWALQSDFEEKVRFNIDREWMGEMPYTQLFKRNGEVTVFAGEADFAELEAWAAAR
jgi:thiol-disulfide isomerase/thioredoxin